MGIVPSGLELGQRHHFLDNCKDVQGEALLEGDRLLSVYVRILDSLSQKHQFE